MFFPRSLDSRHVASSLAVCGAIAFSVLAVACATGDNTVPTGDGGAGGEGTATSSSSGMMASSSGSSGMMASSSSSSSGSGASSSSSGASSSSSSSGAGGSPVMPPTQIITIFGGGSSLIANYSDLAKNMGFATPWQDQSDDVIGLASDGQGTGIGVFRSKTTGELKAAFYQSNTWIPGFGATVAPLEAGLTCEGGTSVAGAGGIGHLVYRGKDGLYYYGKVQGKVWSAKKDPITVGGKQSSGPNPPAVAAVGTTPVIAFVGADNVFYDQTQSGGTWQAAVAHSFGGQAAAYTPAITVLDMGPELLAVFGEAVTNKLYWTVRKSGVWSTPAVVPGATTAESPVVAPLAMGGAMLGYKGTDQLLYTARLSAGDAPTWANPVSGAGAANPMLISAPALARGAIGAEAELIYLDQNYTVYSSRLVAGAWTTPGLTGSASTHISMATVP